MWYYEYLHVADTVLANDFSFHFTILCWHRDEYYYNNTLLKYSYYNIKSFPIHASLKQLPNNYLFNKEPESTK